MIRAYPHSDTLPPARPQLHSATPYGSSIQPHESMGDIPTETTKEAKLLLVIGEEYVG